MREFTCTRVGRLLVISGLGVPGVVVHVCRTLLRWSLASLVVAFSSGLAAETFHAKRLNNSEPVISERHFLNLSAKPEGGNNINGPSVLEDPDWIPRDKKASPGANYYIFWTPSWPLSQIGVGITY